MPPEPLMTALLCRPFFKIDPTLPCCRRRHNSLLSSTKSVTLRASPLTPGSIFNAARAAMTSASSRPNAWP